MDGRQFCLGVLLNISKSPLPNKISRGVMSCQNILLCLVVAAVLTSFCDGQTDEDEGGTALKGLRHLRHLGTDLILKPLAATRSRLLPFRHVKQDDLSSTKVSRPGLAAKLKCLNPSVQCGDNQMTLTVNRIKAPHFLMARGDERHTRLSLMPSTRGFSVKRSRRALQFDARHQGCRVNKEDGEHVLPLLFQEAPKTTSCPNVLTSPAVVCFPSKMVVKLGGVAARDLKIKASGTWQPLPWTCSSCGLTFKEFSGELALVAPYNTNLCVELKDEEYSLSLQWGDYELLAVCPSVPDTTTETPAPSIDDNPALQHPQNAYSQMFSQMFQHWPTLTPAPGAQLPPFFFASTNSPENQKGPEARSPAFSFMPQLPQFFGFPRPELPAQTGFESTPVKQVQFPQMPQSPQYRVPFFSEFPMVPGIVQQATPSPLPATGTEAFPTSEPTQVNKEKLQAYMQSQFSVLPHSFQSFLKHPLFSEDKTQVANYPKTDIEQLQPQHPQVFQFPMLYSPRNYPSKEQNMFTFTAAPATTPTSEGTIGMLPEHSFFQPHPYMPVYLLPEQPSMPSKPTNPASSDQNKHKPVYHPMQPFYPFLPDQRQTVHTRS